MRPNKWSFSILMATALMGCSVYASDLKVGDRFPSLSANKVEGKLADLPKGQVILVDFWASWCIPCAHSFPTMDELLKTYGPKGFTIVAVNVDEKKGDMDHFLKDHPVSFSVVRDAQQKLVDKAGISTMPSSFLLDKDGKVAFMHSGFHGNDTKKEYAHEIEKLLAQGNR